MDPGLDSRSADGTRMLSTPRIGDNWVASILKVSLVLIGVVIHSPKSLDLAHMHSCNNFPMEVLGTHRMRISTTRPLDTDIRSDVYICSIDFYPRCGGAQVCTLLPIPNQIATELKGDPAVTHKPGCLGWLVGSRSRVWSALREQTMGLQHVMRRLLLALFLFPWDYAVGEGVCS